MSRSRLDIRCRRSAAHGDQTASSAGLLKVAHVSANLFGKIHLALALLHIRTVDLLHVVVIEYSWSRSDRGKKRLELIEQTLIEHSRIRSRFIHVVFKDVPTSEGQIGGSSKRDKLLDFWRTSISSLAQPNRSHLCQRTDRLGNALTNRFNSRNKRGRDSAHSRNHYAELALRRVDGTSIRHSSWRPLHTTLFSRQLHLADRAFGVGKSSLAVFMFARRAGTCELFAVTLSIGVPPVGHENSRFLLIHDVLFWWRLPATATKEIVSRELRNWQAACRQS